MGLKYREEASNSGWETANFGAQRVYLSSARHAPNFPARADALPRSSIVFFSDVPSHSLKVFLQQSLCGPMLVSNAIDWLNISRK